MPIGPKYSKHSFKKTRDSALRKFTDREEPTRAFLKALQEKSPNKYKVLTYYGVGGIGKTRLQKELIHKLEQNHPTILKARLDLKEEKYRESGNALIFLKQEIQKEWRIKFTTFDLAYMMYWKKLNPQLSLKTASIDLPFLEEGNFIGEIIDHLEDIPIAQWLPKTLKFVSGLARYKEMVVWWMGKGKEVMEQLQHMLPNEIEEMLPFYWADDLKDYLQSSKKTAIFFIDTYEALWEKRRNQGTFHEKDSWVREFVTQLPEVIWVISGREKLRWEDLDKDWAEFLEQHLMGELSENDSKSFLSSCGITDEQINNIITAGSKGLPYYLDLMVDTYFLINQKRHPEPSDFSKTPAEILDRFLKYLELTEKETIKILSFPREWDYELFQSLVNHFKTGYPATACSELFRFSFFNEKRDQIWEMHTMMQKSLQEEVTLNSPVLYVKVHEYLFAYYNNVLQGSYGKDIQVKVELAFKEASYHGMTVLTEEDYLQWFVNIGRKLYSAGQLQLITSSQKTILSLIENKKPEQLCGDVYFLFASVYFLQGSYNKSFDFFHKALTIFKQCTKGEENLSMGKTIIKCCIGLGELKVREAEYDQAYKYLTDAAESFLSFSEVKDRELIIDQALLHIRLGKLNISCGRYAESHINYNSAITFCEDAIHLDPKDPTIFATKAHAYEKLGELYGSAQPEKQKECYLKSIETYEKALSLDGEIHILQTMANKGLAYKRLAEHYDQNGSKEESIKCFQLAIETYESVLLIAPEFVDAHEKKGHASVDYLVLQVELGLKDGAINSFQMALDAFEKALELAPTQASSRNRISSAYREMAKLYINEQNIGKAIDYLNISVEKSKDVLLHSPSYNFVYNSLAKTYETMAECYNRLQDVKKARQCYELALTNYNNTLDRAPNLRGAIKGKRKIQQILLQL